MCLPKPLSSKGIILPVKDFFSIFTAAVLECNIVYLLTLTIYLLLNLKSVAELAIQVSGRLVAVDILELSQFPCPGVGISHSSMRLGLITAKELNLKLTLGMAETRKTTL